ncbi:MAG: RHS repeat-associated core domain-containing protein [Bacteroidota bacterium]
MTHFRDGEGALSLNLRMYDATIGRWNGVDALAEERNWLSTFQYTQNNPILRVDPDGNLDGDYFAWDGTYLGNDGKDDNKIYRTDKKNFQQRKQSGGTEGFAREVGNKADFIALVATVHAETNGSEGRVAVAYNERRGVAHATLNNNEASNKRARKYGRGTETISETAGRIANVHSDGNPRTNEITDKGFSDWNKDSDIKLSAKAAIHAMVGLGESGRDNTGGAHGWDGISDFQKQYKVRTT